MYRELFKIKPIMEVKSEVFNVWFPIYNVYITTLGTFCMGFLFYWWRSKKLLHIHEIHFS